MQKLKCSHLRIRDDNDYNLNIEALINMIQKEFNVDFTSIPRWQELVKRLHISRTDCKRRIQYANLQKVSIIDKLYMQSTRPSPFELTEVLARTANKWKQMQNKLRKRKTSSIHSSTEITDEAAGKDEGMDEEFETPHPNTEDHSSKVAILHEPSKTDAGVQYNPEHIKQPTTLPVVIVTNTHKLISSIGSNCSQLSYHAILDNQELEGASETKEWQPSTTAVVCNPSLLDIKNNTLGQQSFMFSLTNCTGEYLHVRFKYATDRSPFKKVKVLPVIPKRLYPGIAVVFKFIFKLKNKEPFQSGLYFRIGRDVYANAPTEPLFIPIISTFGLKRSVKVPRTVAIPSVYPWHIKMGPGSKYPTGFVKITVDDHYSYHLHIYKQQVDLSSDSDPYMSMHLSSPNTDSLEDRNDVLQSGILVPENSLAAKSKTSKILGKSKNDLQYKAISMTVNIMSAIIDDIVELALEAFIFDCTYKYLQPHSKITIPVHFTKAEHIGYHQSYYDLKLIDPETETVVMNKTIKALAEVLPHPIQITPIVLDMSESPVSHGYCKDSFIVSNTHKMHPVTVHIQLTTKMKKIFSVFPMNATVLAQSSGTFIVKFCSRESKEAASMEPELSKDLVHFTIKIITVGYKTVYENVPPIFYEIIAPCALEFKKVYSEKYFKETE